jgi:hypothetical protein
MSAVMPEGAISWIVRCFGPKKLLLSAYFIGIFIMICFLSIQRLVNKSKSTDGCRLGLLSKKIKDEIAKPIS